MTDPSPEDSPRFRTIPGRVFDAGADMLVCPVWAVAGGMGPGLAGAFARRYPGLVPMHSALVEQRRLRLGYPIMVCPGGGEHVPVVEEGVFGIADVHEGGFQAGIEVLDLALVDAADHAVIGFALDFEFVEDAVDEEGDAFFERLGVDDEFAEGRFLLFEDLENFFEQGAVFGTRLGAGFQFVAVNGFCLDGGRGIGEFLVIVAGIRGIADGEGGMG